MNHVMTTTDVKRIGQLLAAGKSCNYIGKQIGCHGSSVLFHAKRMGFEVHRSKYLPKLTAQNVQEIRAASGSYKVIANRYGISKNTVFAIKKRLIWKHLP